MPASPPSRVPSVARPSPATELRNILVVQDDPDVRTAWASALKSAGFVPRTMDSVEGLWGALAENTAWRGIVVDLGFLDWKDTEFLDRLREAGHLIPTLLTAWDPELAKSKSALSYPLLTFRPAPLHPRDLIASVRALPLPGGKTQPARQAAPKAPRRPEVVAPKAPVRPPVARIPDTPQARAEAAEARAIAAEARAKAAEERAELAESLRDESLALEMERAREIQARLLPATMPNPDRYEIAAQYLPAAHVGGDYYDVIELPDGRVAMLVADVSGKGISSAMVMVMARTVFHAVAPSAPNAKALVVEAAERIARVLPGGIFLSLAAAILDPKSGRISVVNAGHLPPMHWSVMDGMPVVSDLEVSGGAIGLVKGANFERALHDFTITLQQDEQLVLYTDGVNEAMDEKNEEFGDRKLRVAVRKNGGSTAEEMALGILDSVLYHRGDAPASDDLTILVVRRIC
ncbi:MAG: serine phosphatase RsbU regulator of sigma [Planctomycetota bacterium]|nr:MAG: serine phosphatase RsbU regulator of sigma [Planctomycetota bacterium]